METREAQTFWLVLLVAVLDNVKLDPVIWNTRLDTI